MLAFDIETTGLHPAHSVVTVVCTQDYHTGERRAYEFGHGLARSVVLKLHDGLRSTTAANVWVM